MVPALLLGLIFLIPTWWLWQKGQRAWAFLPFFTFLVVIGFTLAIQLDIRNHRQTLFDLDVLLSELNRPDLWLASDLTNPEARLFLASTGSQALYRAREIAPERQSDIDSTLHLLAEWVANRNNLRQWRRNTNWDREVYFLAHAGATLGHYQLATGELSFERSFKNVGDHLGKRLERGRYKHLPSRPDEDFYRPADNAAALYALSLYDSAYGINYAASNFNDWAAYLSHELYFEESRLPCAAFSSTSRCQLDPSAVATGLYIAYRAAARPEAVDSDIPWREWLHYFGKTSLSPFSMSIRPNMRDNQATRFCDQGAYPLQCNRYETAVGLWAAAEYGGGYSYFRLYSAYALRRWFFDAPNYAGMSAGNRVKALTGVALRGMATGK
ncbi:hypothetical protein [Neolewinella persica]|uniref:hypothetical protein n=1 Tax=Neolewinella persica TaxID=70998 RepID=UPI0003A85E98|nr:hypothetical protein [Neolewinella persica]